MNAMTRLPDVVQKPVRPLRVTMLGLRGFPDVQGGVEHHVQHLACALANLGCDVEAVMRSPYVAKGIGRTWRNVKILPLWTPRTSGVEAFIHTFFGVLHAARTRPDILHIHAIGPALFVPLARAFALRVVVTHHGPNYENTKWSVIGRAILRLGERAGMTLANECISVSRSLADRMRGTYGVAVQVIPNGVDRPVDLPSQSFLQANGLTPNQYVLSVARIDPQKCQLDLIAAFARAKRPDWKLAIVGAADYSTRYAQEVAAAAKQVAGVVMLGYQSGKVLAQLYSHAAVFALPSSHEGQPIALLEALSHGCPAIVSDIAAHRDIDTPTLQRVPVGDIAALAQCLEATMAAPIHLRLEPNERERILRTHDWANIAQNTLRVYLKAVDRNYRH
jgi:glycosyltransferase involved in cell wall biosynthesis